MTTSHNLETAPEAKAESASQGPTAGGLLREARLNAGVHLAVLSVTLKVPVRELEALESNALDMAKGPAFYRGLASSVCRHLGADPAAILALLPPTAERLSPVRKVTGAAVASRNFHLDSSAAGSRSMGKVFWVAMGMLVVIGALLWMPNPGHWTWLANVQKMWASESNTTTVEDVSPVSMLVNEPPLMAQNSDLVGDVVDSPPDFAVVTPPAQLSAEVPLLSDASAAPSGALSGALSGASPGAASGAASGAVGSTADAISPTTTAQLSTSSLGPEWVFSASDDSWLEVRDAQRAIVWSGIVKSGEVARIQSPLPVSVVVGRAQVMAVSFRGQPFDLKPHTRVSVARFKVEE